MSKSTPLSVQNAFNDKLKWLIAFQGVGGV